MAYSGVCQKRETENETRAKLVLSRDHQRGGQRQPRTKAGGGVTIERGENGGTDKIG